MTSVNDGIFLYERDVLSKAWLRSYVGNPELLKASQVGKQTQKRFLSRPGLRRKSRGVHSE